jgi:Cd2+/Zn2+-exporting ATPase/Cu+-exporting ATPase
LSRAPAVGGECAARDPWRDWPGGALWGDHQRGIHLEALWSIDTVVLDKTGTVTFGDVRVQAVYQAAGVSPRQVLEAAASAESRSEHPIGRAILRHTRHAGIPVHESRRFSYVPGQGVRAWWDGDEILVGNSAFVTAGRLPEPAEQIGGSTTVFVVRGGCYLGSVVLADVTRPEAKRALADLRALKLQTVLLTGDSRPATERVARDLGVDDFETGLMPDAKHGCGRSLTTVNGDVTVTQAARRSTRRWDQGLTSPEKVRMWSSSGMIS